MRKKTSKTSPNMGFGLKRLKRFGPIKLGGIFCSRPWRERRTVYPGGPFPENRLLLVVFCERLSGDVVRLISARKTTRKERKEYEEGI